ncbi:MAG TPA: hypothetical protein GXX75_25555 [Clostridiales bacterium]|nr:hypothetical protein [Clostridiales bacterium]
MADQDLFHTAEIVKAAIPFVDGRTQGMADLFIKVCDLMGSVKAARNPQNLAACGFTFENIDFEGLLAAVRPVCNKRERDFVDRILNFFHMKKMFEMYNNMMETMKTMQEFGGFPFGDMGQDDASNVTSNFSGANFESIFQTLKNFTAQSMDGTEEGAAPNYSDTEDMNKADTGYTDHAAAGNMYTSDIGNMGNPDWNNTEHSGTGNIDGSDMRNTGASHMSNTDNSYMGNTDNSYTGSTDNSYTGNTDNSYTGNTGNSYTKNTDDSYTKNTDGFHMGNIGNSYAGNTDSSYMGNTGNSYTEGTDSSYMGNTGSSYTEGTDDSYTGNSYAKNTDSSYTGKINAPQMDESVQDILRDIKSAAAKDSSPVGKGSSPMFDMLKSMVPADKMSTIENLSMLFNSMSYDNNSKSDDQKGE